MRLIRLPSAAALTAALAATLGACACQPVLAQDAPAWIGAPDCRLDLVKPAPARPPSWHGGCKDGYAEGKGTLEWRSDKGQDFKLEAIFKAGHIEGEATITYPNGIVYIGTMARGLPDGHGYYRYPDGGQYEGDVRQNKTEGSGEMLYENGNDYKGQWKNDQRQGVGVETFMLGGRYEGGWNDDKPSGAGKLVYAGEPPRETATVDWRMPSQSKASAAEPGTRYVVKHDLAPAGSMIRQDAARAVPVPPALSYEQLSPEQQDVVNSRYPALAPGDEPPYPLHGPAQFYKAASTLGGKFLQRGDLHIYVTVDKNGKAASVKAIGLDDPEARKLLATAAALVQYKPARCAGQPCDMMYGYNLKLTLEP